MLSVSTSVPSIPYDNLGSICHALFKLPSLIYSFLFLVKRNWVALAYVCEIYLCETRKGKTLLACLHAAIELKSHITLQSNLLAFLVILIHQRYLSCVPWIGLSWQCLIS